MVVVPVYRCSTDDKGQRPERQVAVMSAWGRRFDVQLARADGDEGKSAEKTSPFEREGFLRQLALAERIARETGETVPLLFEMVDRFTRRDLDELGWAKTEVRRRTEGRVVVWFCEVGGPEDQAKPMARLLAGFKTESAKDENDKRRARIPGGMQLAVDEGQHVGRPPKSLSAAELERARLLLGQGYGEEKIAVLINEERRVHLLTDAGERKRRSVSAWVVRKALGRKVKTYTRKLKAQGNSARPAARGAQAKDILSSEGSE